MMNKTKMIIITFIIFIGVCIYINNSDKKTDERDALYSMMLIVNAENIIDDPLRILTMGDNNITLNVDNVSTVRGVSIADGTIEDPINKICKNLLWEFSNHGEDYQLMNVSNCY